MQEVYLRYANSMCYVQQHIFNFLKGIKNNLFELHENLSLFVVCEESIWRNKKYPLSRNRASIVNFLMF